MSPRESGSDPRTVVYNGVAVPTTSPEQNRDYWPEFEEGTSGALRRVVDRGDDVVVVGGGKGITTVVSARMARIEGSVTTYEANSEMIETLQHTLKVNQVSDTVTLHHAAIGPVSEQAIEMFGPSDGDQFTSADLPACDVLELDVEGSEVDILRNMDCRPRAIVVETHEPIGVPPEDVAEVLEEIGYEITNRTPAGLNNKLMVLTAVRKQNVEGE
ncbi:FkbM family methyltransferase [Halomarina pelagica]|uniref:FkbM family methyltransferase n=1 Tax=Halomarina pelagica TaxID=2961599 RepID=UPI0020C4F95A|nr:FkbM family methyltransferase [Halomarina sp. BND7]